MILARKKSPLVWSLIVLVVLSVAVILPDLPKANFSIASREISLQMPQLPSRIFLWGRPIQLKPEYVLDLSYKSGYYSPFVINEKAETDDSVSQIDQPKLADQIQKRVSTFFSQPAGVHFLEGDDYRFLVVETPRQVGESVMAALATQPAEVQFYVQKEEIDEDDLIFADDWLDSFEEIGISNAQINSAKGMIDFQSGQPMVALRLNEEGRDALFKTTRENRDQTLAATIDGSLVLLSPIIEPIHQGRISVSGGMSREQAELIAAMIDYPIQERVLLVDDVAEEEGEIEIHYEQLPKIQKISFLGLIELEPLQTHLAIGFFLLLVASLVSLFTLKKDGYILVVLLWSTFFVNAALLRLSEFVVSWPVIVSLFLVIFYWWVVSIALLLNYRCLITQENISTKEALLQIFAFKNKIIIKSAALLLLSALLSTSFGNSRHLQNNFSPEFVQSLFQHSLLTVSLSAVYLLTIRDALLSEFNEN